MAKAAPAPLDSSLLGVPKGAAAPAAEVPTTPQQQPDPAPAPAPAAAQRPAPPSVAALPAEEPRTALTVRLPVSTQERLREASHRLRQEKQHIVDEALIAWLEERGF
ncbi:MAG: hypothetical protein ACJ8AI_17895 [Rhodopila sp.]